MPKCNQGPAEEGDWEGSVSVPTDHSCCYAQFKNQLGAAAIQGGCVMLWGAACLGFFGFLCTGVVVVPSDAEYDLQVHLSFQDVKVDDKQNSKWLEVHLKTSKTDLFRQGVTKYVGATGKCLCPVASVLAYMVHSGNKPGPLFIFRDGRQLTRPHFVTALQAALRNAGYNEGKYASHSPRLGAATTASQCGIQDSLIQMMGRWCSNAYML